MSAWSVTSGATPATVSPGDSIVRVRGHSVILDSDLAALYGVETKRLNEQVKRNEDRFPEDFHFQLSEKEWKALRSQSATSKGRGGRRYRADPLLRLSDLLRHRPHGLPRGRPLRSPDEERTMETHPRKLVTIVAEALLEGVQQVLRSKPSSSAPRRWRDKPEAAGCGSFATSAGPKGLRLRQQLGRRAPRR